jgi:hypothetical protein
MKLCGTYVTIGYLVQIINLSLAPYFHLHLGPMAPIGDLGGGYPNKA